MKKNALKIKFLTMAFITRASLTKLYLELSDITVGHLSDHFLDLASNNIDRLEALQTKMEEL